MHKQKIDISIADCNVSDFSISLTIKHALSSSDLFLNPNIFKNHLMEIVGQVMWLKRETYI